MMVVPGFNANFEAIEASFPVSMLMLACPQSSSFALHFVIRSTYYSVSLIYKKGNSSH